MSTLRTDYKDDVFTGSRKYRMIDNGDGTVSFEDATTYTQTGDTYGAAEINEVNSRLNGLDGSVYKAEDSAETTIADNDYFPYFDTSANASKKSLWSNIKNVLKNTLAIKEHDSSSAGTYGAGTNSKYGHVKLSDTYTNGTSQASSSVGASEYAVSQAYADLYKAMDSHGREPGSPSTSQTKHFYFDFHNGKYGWNESSNRPLGTFHPFESMEYLGVGTSFNVSSRSDYRSLTAENFICEPAESGELPSNFGPGDAGGSVGFWGITGGSVGISKSYDSSTGILTAYFSGSAECGVNEGRKTSSTGQLSVKCWVKN